MKRRYLIRFSGAASSPADVSHDGKMKVKYCYCMGNASVGSYIESDGTFPLENGKVPYGIIIPDSIKRPKLEKLTPLMFNYETDGELAITPPYGAFMSSERTSASYSLYRREYDVYQKPAVRVNGYYRDSAFFYEQSSSARVTPRRGYVYIDKNTGVSYEYDFTDNEYHPVPQYSEFKGEWHPVALATNQTSLRDYNVTSGRSYQYIIYPNQTDVGAAVVTQQLFANHDGLVYMPSDDYVGHGSLVPGTDDTAHLCGEPVRTKFNEWSIVELIPMTDNLNLPIAKQVYKANLDQLWLLRFSLDTGSQTQNISRSEFQTLGAYPRMGFGNSNAMSGSISAMLGSEIVPYSTMKYVERRPKARVAPTSTNEKSAMLAQWQKFVYSRNPKLLRDMKGDAWIVQITSSSNKPQNFYRGQPDTVSFQWKQVGDVSEAIIYGDGGYREFEEKNGSAVWESAFVAAKNGNNAR